MPHRPSDEEPLPAWMLRKYGPRGRRSGAELLLSHRDALEFVDDCEAAGLVLLGMEFYLFRDGTVRPMIGNPADYSAIARSPDAVRATTQEARVLLAPSLPDEADLVSFVVDAPSTPEHALRYCFHAGSGICLWAANDRARERWGYPVDARSLPFTSETQRAIDELLARYDASLDGSDPGGPGHWTEKDWRRFLEDARAVKETISRELGPGFVVKDESFLG